MSIKKYSGSYWSFIDEYYNTLKKCLLGEVFTDVNSVKRYDGTHWAEAYSSVNKIEWELKYTYGASGNEDYNNDADGLWLYAELDYNDTGDDMILVDITFNTPSSSEGIPVATSMLYSFHGYPSYSEIYVYRKGVSIGYIDLSNKSQNVNYSYTIPALTDKIRFSISTDTTFDHMCSFNATITNPNGYGFKRIK